jgi:acyl-CoA synthetase (AMP-forming)/AMP-acid ligase II
MQSESFSTILRRRAQSDPQRPAFTFLNGSGTPAHMTYGELDRDARRLAARLQRRGAGGERILLLCDPGLDFIRALFACFYAGATPVPVHPFRLNRRLDRLQAIVRDAQARFGISRRARIDVAGAVVAGVAGSGPVRWIALDELGDASETDWREPCQDAQSIALLQYTSGSTGDPKGVVVTHGNLLANCDMMRVCFAATQDDRAAMWLPPYHDMGLIGGILQPVFVGCHAVLLDPVYFLKHPLAWLRAISDYKATCSGGPNFAYQLCADKIGAMKVPGLELSSWRLACIGAEPIRAETLQRFTEAFAPYGFKQDAFCTCYGLAEATLMVSGPRQRRYPIVKSVSRSALVQGRAVEEPVAGSQAQFVVGCGQCVAEDQEFRIVDPDQCCELPAGRIGEIWVRGPSVTQGYFNRPEESRQAFAASLRGSGKGQFLRTGDLGFVENGELFVTGRIKDLIIIAGRNHHPEDIEWTVQECGAASRFGATAAFAIDAQGAERLVILQEIDGRGRDLSHASDRISRAVAEAHGIRAHTIAFTRLGSIPRTTSNKIRRAACRTAFLKGEIDIAPSKMPERRLQIHA